MKKRIRSLYFQIPAVINVFVAVIIIISILTLSAMSRNAIDSSMYEGFYTTIKGYATYFNSFIEDQLIFADTYSSFPSVKRFVQYRNLEDKNDVRSLFNSVGRKNPYVSNLYLLDTDGTIFDSFYGDDADVGKRASELYSDLWYKYDNTKSGTLSESLYKNKDGRWILAIIDPVHGNNNEYTGCLLMILDWQLVIEEISKIAGEVLSLWVRLWVFNHDTLLIMHNVPSEVGKFAPVEVKTIVDSKEGKLEFQNDGMTKVCLYTKLDVMPWHVAFSMPLSFITSKSTRILFISILLIVIGIILSLITGIAYVRYLIKPLKILAEEAREMTQGTFVLRKFRFNKNEIGDMAYAFRDMRNALFDIVNQVNQSSDSIRAAAKKLSSGSDDLAARTESQAASLEETSSSIEEMASTVKSSAQHSVEGNDMMISSRDAVDKGAKVVAETTRNIEEVYEASEKIKNITKTIEDIAFQTNILALNASVEAARAGDQGRGFAVVASEVRNLAQNSQASAKDITLLIENIYEKINKSAETARESQTIFNDIQSKIEDTAKIMQEISTTAVEQETGVNQVNIAISRIDGLTQQNVALVDETSAYSRELLEYSKSLQELMKFFKFEK